VRDEAREALAGGTAPDSLSLQKMKQVQVQRTCTMGQTCIVELSCVHLFSL
jgi:hypothetical protein